MSETTLQEFIERKDYSRIHSSIEIPDLIEIQKRSYEEFLQREVEPERRKDHGLQAALASVFPIPDYNNTAVLEFTSYTLGTPKYDERECLEQGMTFAVPLKLRVRLVVFDKEDKGSKKKVLDVREQIDLRYSAFTSFERAGPTDECVQILRQLSADETLGHSARSLLSMWHLE